MRVWSLADRGGGRIADPILRQPSTTIARQVDAGAFNTEGIEEPECRWCGCTPSDPCPGGCFWIPDPEGIGDLCSRCGIQMGIPVMS